MININVTSKFLMKIPIKLNYNPNFEKICAMAMSVSTMKPFNYYTI